MTKLVPLVKNKAGNLSDINNYKAIAISPALSKLFECLLEKYIRSYDTPDDCQFGFKSGLSIQVRAPKFLSKLLITTQTGSHVFACFVDFSKAFDRVNYWTLFNKLLDDNVNCNIVRILAV